MIIPIQIPVTPTHCPLLLRPTCLWWSCRLCPDSSCSYSSISSPICDFTVILIYRNGSEFCVIPSSSWYSFWYSWNSLGIAFPSSKTFHAFPFCKPVSRIQPSFQSPHHPPCFPVGPLLTVCLFRILLGKRSCGLPRRAASQMLLAFHIGLLTLLSNIFLYLVTVFFLETGNQRQSVYPSQLCSMTWLILTAQRL